MLHVPPGLEGQTSIRRAHAFAYHCRAESLNLSYCSSLFGIMHFCKEYQLQRALVEEGAALLHAEG